MKMFITSHYWCDGHTNFIYGMGEKGLEFKFSRKSFTHVRAYAFIYIYIYI